MTAKTVLIHPTIQVIIFTVEESSSFHQKQEDQFIDVEYTIQDATNNNQIECHSVNTLLLA